MHGHRPIGCCDRECALVNHCREGGFQCARCGSYFCKSDLNGDCICDECAAEIANGEDDEEDGTVLDV